MTLDRHGFGRRLPWVIAAVVACVGAFATVTSVLSSYWELGLLDAQVYRMGGRAMLDGVPLYETAYPWDSLPFTYTPFAAMLFVPLAAAGWSGGALLLSALSVASVMRVAQLACRLASAGRFVWLPPLPMVAVCAVVTSWPIRSTLEYGQINLIIMALVVEDLVGVGRKWRWSGLLLGLAAGIKLTPLIFLTLLVARRQWRQSFVAIAAFIGTVVIGFTVQPASAWTYWSIKVFDSSRIGDSLNVSNQSISGMIARWAGAPLPILWAIASFAVVLLAAWLGARLWDNDRPLDALLIVAIGGLLVSPISWSHHWVWLVPSAIVLAAPQDTERGDARVFRAALFVLVVVMGSIRVQSLVPHTDPVWTVLHPSDWLAGNLLVVLAVGLFVGAWRSVKSADSQRHNAFGAS